MTLYRALHRYISALKPPLIRLLQDLLLAASCGCMATNRSNSSRLICTRLPFQSRNSTVLSASINYLSFPSPMRKKTAASSMLNVHFSKMGTSYNLLIYLKISLLSFLIYNLSLKSISIYQYSSSPPLTCGNTSSGHAFDLIGISPLCDSHRADLIGCDKLYLLDL